MIVVIDVFAALIIIAVLLVLFKGVGGAILAYLICAGVSFGVLWLLAFLIVWLTDKIP
jgi:hypothetical protein